MRQNVAVDCEKAELTLVDVLQRCMWRTCKSKVDAELQIPPQSEQVHRIRLSNLEKLFYTEQHALCESSFQHVLRKHLGSAEGILKISPKIMKIVCKLYYLYNRTIVILLFLFFLFFLCVLTDFTAAVENTSVVHYTSCKHG